MLAQRVHCTRDRVLQRALRVGLEAEPAPAHNRRLHLPHCCFPRQILTQLQYPKVQRHERITFVCYFLLYSSFLIVVSGNLFAIVLLLPFPSRHCVPLPEAASILMSEKRQPGTKSSAMLSNSLLSSPPRTSQPRNKERRNPSITPRKFQRFFTPRSRVSSKPSAARKALRDLAGPALNRCQTPSSPLKPISEENGANDFPVRRGPKRQKVQHTPDRSASQLLSPLNTSPPQLQTPDSRPALRSPIQSLRALNATQESLDLEDSASEDEDAPTEPNYKHPVPLTRRGLTGQLFQRMTGGIAGASHRTLRYPAAGRFYLFIAFLGQANLS